jgi:magnesium transporter
MVTTIFETNLSLQDTRLNNIMKKLTGWAAIHRCPESWPRGGRSRPGSGAGVASGAM